MRSLTEFRLACPIPYAPTDVIQMAHGGGGRVAQRLLDTVFFPAFSNPSLEARHDASAIGEGLAVSTDAFVVSPWRFPGGDIGSLAVHGTVNDLAMGGARALALTAAFVLEEGMPIEELSQIVHSMQAAAIDAGVTIAAGDTKVVERGKGDGVYIATTGVGRVVSRIDPRGVLPGDLVLVSGDVGRHGAAVMSVREGLALDTPILSDSAAVHEPALALLDAGIQVRCLRDPTRGGLASILNEIARASNVGIRIEEGRVPVQEDVAGVCELFGLDPLYVACEGRFVAFVAPEDADRALAVMRRHPVSSQAVRIGVVIGDPGQVTLLSRIGVERVLDLLSGEQLPRIC